MLARIPPGRSGRSPARLRSSRSPVRRIERVNATMLVWRLFLGPILIAALAGLFVLDAYCSPTAPILWALACLLTWRSSWEMVQLLQTRFAPNLPLCVVASLAIVCANWIAPLANAPNPAQ